MRTPGRISQVLMLAAAGILWVTPSQAYYHYVHFLTGKAPYPVERTLLTTGLTAAGVESLFRGQTRYETPHLAIRYQPAKESTFWRT